ncbi:hypothetical protein [Streptomyces griseus]
MATPLDGGPVSRQLLKASRQDIAAAKDGSVTVVGGVGGQAGDREWGVHRITEGPDGVPVPERVIDLAPLPWKIQGIGLSGGRLTVADGRLSNLREATVRTLSVSGTPTYGPRVPARITFDTACGPEDPTAARCSAPSTAVSPSSPGGAVPRATKCATARATLHHRRLRRHAHGRRRDVRRLHGRGGGRTDRLPVVRAGEDPHPEAGRVRPVDADPVERGGEAGHGDETVLETGRTKQTVDLGTGCAPRELQALGRWLYWSCGESGPAGVST